MKHIDHLLRTVSSALSLLALIVLLFVVAGNVLGRLLLDLTGGGVNLMISGAIELAAYSLLILVFGSITSAIPDGLVEVDILEDLFPHQLAVFLEIFWLIIMAVGAGIIAYLFAETALVSSRRGAFTQDLQLPLSAFYWVTSAQCTIIAVVTLLSAFSLIGKDGSKPADKEAVS